MKSRTSSGELEGVWEKEGNSIRVDNGEEETLSVEGRRRRIKNCMSNKKGGGENLGGDKWRGGVEWGGRFVMMDIEEFWKGAGG